MDSVKFKGGFSKLVTCWVIIILKTVDNSNWSPIIKLIVSNSFNLPFLSSRLQSLNKFNREFEKFTSTIHCNFLINQYPFANLNNEFLPVLSEYLT